MAEEWLQRLATVVARKDDANLPGRQEWVEMRSFIGIMYWTLLECLDFLVLSPKTQDKLQGSISSAVSRLAVRMRIFDIFNIMYIQPQFKGAIIGRRGPYAVLLRQLLADVCNSAQLKAGVPNPVHVKRGTGAVMNDQLREMHAKVRD